MPFQQGNIKYKRIGFKCNICQHEIRQVKQHFQKIHNSLLWQRRYKTKYQCNVCNIIYDYGTAKSILNMHLEMHSRDYIAEYCRQNNLA